MSNRWGLRVVVVALLALLMALQYRLWVGEGSLAEVRHLERQIAAQQEELAVLRERNEALRAEVTDLRAGLEAIEARARGELGMIREGETFFQVIEPLEAGARE
jgi:cell division protein FtsB